MELKHPEKHQIYKDYRQKSNSSVCLADICPIFGCQIFVKSSQGRNAENGISSFNMQTGHLIESFSDVHVCNEADVMDAKQQCTQMMQE